MWFGVGLCHAGSPMALPMLDHAASSPDVGQQRGKAAIVCGCMAALKIPVADDGDGEGVHKRELLTRPPLSTTEPTDKPDSAQLRNSALYGIN